MKFVLINPFYPISESPSPPLGLAYLGAALKQAGVEVKILDFVVYPYSAEYLKSVLTSFQPDMIGLTSVTMTFDAAMDVIKDAKKLYPAAATVMGGPHVTFCAEETLKAHPEVDYIVMGEGEEGIVELAQAVESGAGLDDIAGLAYRKDGRITISADRPPGIDLDSLPLPARELLPLGRYRALGMALSMTTSRGCPFQCIFCVGRKMVGAKVRYRSPKGVVDELERLAAMGFTQVNIADDLFTANKKHCLAVCDEIIKRGLNVKWTSFARVDTVSVEVLKRMKVAGCTAVSFGIETGSPEIMKTIKKGVTLDQAVEAAKMCNEAEVTPHASFILGLPGETPETIEETMRFGEVLGEYNVAYGFHLLAPFPGTRVRDFSAEYGLKILTDDWREYHANRAIVATASVSKEMLDEAVMKWERKFDGYLGLLKEQFIKGEIDERQAWPILNLERIVLIYDLMMDGVLEKLGDYVPADPEATGEEALVQLAKKIETPSGKSSQDILAALDPVFKRGDLGLIRDNDRIRWEWMDQL